MNRYAPSLLVAALGAGFLLLVLVTVGPLAGGRGRPTELQPAEPAAPPARPVANAPSADAGQPPTPAPEVVEVHDLATLMPVDADRLNGKSTLSGVVIGGPRHWNY